MARVKNNVTVSCSQAEIKCCQIRMMSVCLKELAFTKFGNENDSDGIDEKTIRIRNKQYCD